MGCAMDIQIVDPVTMKSFVATVVIYVMEASSLIEIV
jgi:hypothetical protein